MGTAAVVVTVGYMLVAMWVSWLAGAGTHAIIDAHRPPVDNLTVYKIGVDLNGNTSSQCREYFGPGSVDEDGRIDKGARNE